jgi:hypothetical protein
VLQQPFSQDAIGGQEGTTAAKSLAQGAADQGDSRQIPGQAPATGPEHPEGMGLIEQQQGIEAAAQGRQRSYIRAGAVHAEQAFAHHQQAARWSGRILVGAQQTPFQVGQVVGGKALQAGAAGPHPQQQRMVAVAIGQHQGVAIGEGHQGGEVGLEATGEQQHLVAAQPLGQLLL